MNRRKMKEFLVGLTVVTCVCLTVVLFNTNKISSKASSGEVVYATFTNPNSKNEGCFAIILSVNVNHANIAKIIR